MKLKDSPASLVESQRDAAVLLACRWKQKRVAREVGRSEQTICTWKKQPGFQQLVRTLSLQREQMIMEESVAFQKLCLERLSQLVKSKDDKTALGAIKVALKEMANLLPASVDHGLDTKATSPGVTPTADEPQFTPSSLREPAVGEPASGQPPKPPRAATDSRTSPKSDTAAKAPSRIRSNSSTAEPEAGNFDAMVSLSDGTDVRQGVSPSTTMTVNAAPAARRSPQIDEGLPPDSLSRVAEKHRTDSPLTGTDLVGETVDQQVPETKAGTKPGAAPDPWSLDRIADRT